MGTGTNDGLTREEKLVLSFLAVAGVAIWAFAAMFMASRYRASAQGHNVQPPLVHDNWTPTPTPLFWSTATPEPTFTLPPEPSPTLPPDSTPVPTAMALLPLGDQVEVIAVLGIDEPHGAAIWRTDSIMLAFVDRQNRRLSLLSIPRDLWVQIPGHPANRINTVDALGERTNYPGGGRGLLDETLRLNLGVPVDHYVRIDFQGFVDIVDTMGGVTIDIKKPIVDKYPDPASPTEWTWIELPAGPMYMDGRMALIYARLRYTTGDFDRASRQQQVLFALAQKALTVETLTRAPQLWNQFQHAIDTDLDITQAVELAYFAKELPADQIRSRQIEHGLVQDWMTPEGAQVLLPKNEAIRQFILELVNGP